MKGVSIDTTVKKNIINSLIFILTVYKIKIQCNFDSLSFKKNKKQNIYFPVYWLISTLEFIINQLFNFYLLVYKINIQYNLSDLTLKITFHDILLW